MVQINGRETILPDRIKRNICYKREEILERRLFQSLPHGWLAKMFGLRVLITRETSNINILYSLRCVIYFFFKIYIYIYIYILKYFFIFKISILKLLKKIKK